MAILSAWLVASAIAVAGWVAWRWHRASHAESSAAPRLTDAIATLPVFRDVTVPNGSAAVVRLPTGFALVIPNFKMDWDVPDPPKLTMTAKVVYSASGAFAKDGEVVFDGVVPAGPGTIHIKQWEIEVGPGGDDGMSTVRAAVTDPIELSVEKGNTEWRRVDLSGKPSAEAR
jgi:hypothetical protein